MFQGFNTSSAPGDKFRSVLVGDEHVPFAGLVDASGNPFTSANRLPVSLPDGFIVELANGSQIALDAATLAALENITASVSGTVELGSTTLAALETINAVVSGSVNVSNAIALDSATLAALENISAIVSGTVNVGNAVALDAPTLAALENITATISGTVPVSGPLTDAQLRANPVPVSGSLSVGAAAAASTYPYMTMTSTNLTSVSATARRLHGIVFQNLGTLTQYLRIYDLAAAPAVNATGLIRRHLIYAGQTLSLYFGERGIALANGLGFSVTGAAVDTTATNAQASNFLSLDWTA